MTEFWAFIAAMTLVALVFVVPPLFLGRRAGPVERSELNTAVIKDALRELKSDLQTGKLDEQAYQAARADLERELLDNAGPGPQEAESDPASRGRSGLWIGALLAILLPLAAVLIYQQLGAQGILPRLAAVRQSTPPTAEVTRHAGIEQMVAELAKRLRDQPDNLEGWILLGRSYAALERYREAAGAYARAYRLANDNPGLIVDYADLLISANGGRFTQEVGRLLDEALALQPDNLKAHWLMGTWNYRQGDYRGAIDHWQRVESRLPRTDQNAVLVARQIRQAKLQLASSGEPMPAVSEQNSVSDQNGKAASSEPPPASIPVRVSLAPALQDRVEGDETLFIYARALNGPPMPLAIVRKQVGDLPLTVTLDDSQAMSPAMSLSKFDQVEIQARVSRTGQAMTASGDLRGSQSPISTTGGKMVDITIDEVVP